MEIVHASAGLLTNYEVLEALKRMPYPSLTKFRAELQLIKQIADQTVKLPDDEDQEQQSNQISQHSAILSTSPDCQSIESTQQRYLQLKALEQTVWLREKLLLHLQQQTPATVNSQSINNFLNALGQFLSSTSAAHLTKAEILQIINLLPLSEVELSRVVEEREERFNQQQTETLLQLIRQHLLGQSSDGNANAAAAEPSHFDQPSNAT